MSSTIEINGKKAEIITISRYFRHTFYHTADGVVVNGSYVNCSFPCAQSAEDAVVVALRSYNLKNSLSFGSETGLLSPQSRVRRVRSWQTSQKSDKLFELLFGGEDGGLAVGVKVDSLGRAVDYISLLSWALKEFELPEGNWHYICYRA